MATLATRGALSATAPDRARPRAVAAWLLVCCALVFAMVVVGGVTRLTHSGCRSSSGSRSSERFRR
jgi:hypothetical protein